METTSNAGGGSLKRVVGSAPMRLCCGHRHFGVVCPDGQVMCCLCFKRYAQDELNIVADGVRENVCKKCAEKERKAKDVARTGIVRHGIT